MSKTQMLNFITPRLGAIDKSDKTAEEKLSLFADLLNNNGAWNTVSKPDFEFFELSGLLISASIYNNSIFIEIRA